MQSHRSPRCRPVTRCARRCSVDDSRALADQVVRAFEDGDVVHVDGRVDPLADIEVIETELVNEIRTMRLEMSDAAVASIIDTLDGRVARLLKGTSKFGAELDSLSDFVNFGVTPALILYLWTLDKLGGLGWIIVLGFAVCGALRLARFNISQGRTDPRYFVGMPITAGAACVASVVVAWPDPVVAIGHALGHLDRFGQRFGNAARNHEGKNSGQQDGQNRQADHQLLCRIGGLDRCLALGSRQVGRMRVTGSLMGRHGG